MGLHLQYVHKVDLEGGNHRSSMLRCYVQMLHALEVNVVHQLVWSVLLLIVSLLHYPTDISPSSHLFYGVLVSPLAVWWTSLHAKLDSEGQKDISGFTQPAW